jgi:gamma-glutamyl:cysteine ligase YbdK (ATP-grasp superfamily)
MFRILEVLGPEHEFALVDEALHPVPVVDQVIKKLRGRIANYADCQTFMFGKELQAHVAELSAIKPFVSPISFEATMQNAIEYIQELLSTHFAVQLLGTGMHPLLFPHDVKIWAHRDRQIYSILHQLFNLYQHGWVNIHAFQLNLPYGTQSEAIRLHYLISQILPYIVAISASSPLCEGRFSGYVDTRLFYYQQSQVRIPSLLGHIVPETVSSFHEYRQKIISRYSRDLAAHGAPQFMLHREWLNSRGAIFRFDRHAIEIRIMDEQECIRADVAMSCFLRACLRGLFNQQSLNTPRQHLIQDFHAVMQQGLKARVLHQHGPTAKHVCRMLLHIATNHATREEKQYLSSVKRRIEEGNLADLLRRDIEKKAQKTTMHEAILTIYARLIQNLQRNEMYF